MAWMRLEAAAGVLECSPRTIRRRAAAGEFDSKRQGRAMLYHVEDDRAVANVATVGRQLSNVAAGSAIQSRAQAETLAGAVATFERAEQRAIRTIRWSLAVVAGVCIGAVALVLVRVDQHHTETVEHVAEIARLRSELGHESEARKTAEAETARVLDAHLAGYGLQVAGR